ncbi:elongation factor 1-gamma [Cyclospora cayetanensis]|uniref:Elongation factor 1-gamma n=1 Tax=Cyclospora cayetanensis TaxID=88456 RepID=A0A1D3CR16_9EIME|nr:elongation factor 1-gamma [Cyclospora cayetanensis]
MATVTTLKLLCPKDELSCQKVLMTATFANVKVETPAFVMGKDDKKECFKSKYPFFRLPILETGEGPSLMGSNTVCRFLARMRNDKRLYGETLQHSAEVDMWLDFCANELEVPLLAWAAQSCVANKAKTDVTIALRAMNEHLKLRTYMVGERITIADLCLCVVVCFATSKFGCDLVKPYLEVSRWMETICNQKPYKNICPTTSNKPCVASSSAQAAKLDDDGKKAEAAEEVPPPPKPKCELDHLPPSSLDLNEWKRVYSNTKDLKGQAMPWLWKNFDAAGYCFYYMKYEKLEGECTVPFLTSNQLGGFLQRVDNNFRKYSFGVINVVGKDSSYDIQGVWMFRGQDIPQMMKEHPSFEYNLWKRLDHTTTADKALIEDYFCNEDEVEKTPIADSKVWK